MEQITTPKRAKGRPEGRAYPHVRAIRLSDRDHERVTRLALKLELPEVAIIRQAIRELAQREGLE